MTTTAAPAAHIDHLDTWTPTYEDQRAANRGIAHWDRGSRVRVIDADNNSPGEVDWGPEVAAVPFAVYLTHEGRYRTVAFDLDAKTVSDGVVSHEADLLKSILAAAGLSYVECNSGPSGGRHLLVPFDGDGVPGHRVKDLGQWLEDKLELESLDRANLTGGSSACIRPPYAPHRHGGWSAPLTSPEETLELLQQRNDPQRFNDLVRALPRGRAKRVVVRSESPGGRDREYDSGSEKVAGFALQMVNRHYSRADFFQAATAGDAPLQVMEAVRRKTTKKALHRWLNLAYDKAVRYAAANPVRSSQATDREVVSDWQNGIDNVYWALPDPERRVALSLADRCHRNGSRLQIVSTRGIAEDGNIARSTASEGLSGLRSRGMIASAYVGGPRAANGYRLTPVDRWDCCSLRTEASTRPLKGRSVPVRGLHAAAELAGAFGADVWAASKSGGLGERVRLAYLALVLLAEADTLTARTSDVARQLGTTPGNATRLLKRLEASGLARNMRNGSWLPEVRDAHQLAEELGVSGVAERRARRHRWERQRDLVKAVVESLIWREMQRVEQDLAILTCGTDRFPTSDLSPEMCPSGPLGLPIAYAQGDDA